MDSFEGLTEEFENILAKSIQSDYKCLETYQTNQAVLDCPLYAFGGDQDIIVNVEDTERWKEHTVLLIPVLSTTIFLSEKVIFILMIWRCQRI